MGSCTFTLDDDPHWYQTGGEIGFGIAGTITMSASYATGGDTLTAATCGLGAIRKVIICGAGLVGSPATTAYLVTAVQAKPITLIQAFQAAAASNPFTEVTATTNLSTVTFSVVVFGT